MADVNPLSQAFVDQVLAGQAVDAEASFRSMIAMKVNDALNARKVEVASSLYGQEPAAAVEAPPADAPVVDAAPSSSEPA